MIQRVYDRISRFFSSLDQYEILQMTDEQMEVLAADPARQTRERDPHDCGENPGLLILDFRRLREEFDRLRNDEVSILVLQRRFLILVYCRPVIASTRASAQSC